MLYKYLINMYTAMYYCVMSLRRCLTNDLDFLFFILSIICKLSFSI